MKLYIECCTSKNDSSKTYLALKADTPLKKGTIISMETDVILLLADLRPSELYAMQSGERKDIVVDNE